MALIGACASTPTATELERAMRSPAARTLPPHLDGRSRFRASFCSKIAVDTQGPVSPTACEDLLWRLDDEPALQESWRLPPAISPRDRIFVVSGAFGDCRVGDLTPFGEAIARLARQGVRIEAVVVGGRSSSTHNARQLARVLRAAELADDERVVLVGYSKGAVDILQLLIDDPALARRVAAVVSLSGPIYGSLLAQRGALPYRTMFARSFESLCDPGDGGVLDSLVPATRRQWLDTHPLPTHVRYFSLAAFTTGEHLSRALRPAWSVLAQTDPLNDGQVLARDAIIPGSTLLGFANADHWDVALALDGVLPSLAHRSSPREFPRAALLEAMLLFVDAMLGPDGDSSVRPGPRS